MAKAYANRAWMTTSTAGTGTITLGSAKAGYLTFAEAGVANTDTVTYVIIDGDDFEIGTGTYTSSGTTMSRDTVIASKISGVAGTTKLTLSGTAEVFLSPSKADIVFDDVTNTFTANQVIEVTDNTNAALRITQLGTGLALRVEDNTNPDSTPFVVDASGNMGIGTDSPSSQIDVITTGGGTASIFNRGEGVTQNGALRYSTDATAPVTLLRKARGTIASPSAVASSDVMGVLRFQAYGGTNNRTLAEVQATVETYTSDSDISSYLSLLTSPSGGVTAVERVRITGAGSMRGYNNAGANPGVFPAKHWISLTADYALTNVGTEQKLFNTTTNGALTIATGVYEFRCLLYLTGMSATSGNCAFDPIGAGTATGDRFGYATWGLDNTTPTTPAAVGGSIVVAQQSATNIVTAGTGTAMWGMVQGMFRCTASGTIIPSITLTTANAATAKAGTWFMCAKIGETTENYVGAWT